MKQTCSQRLRWLHSLQFKYMVTLFVIVFIACAITYMIMFMSVWRQVRHAAEEQLQSITDFLTSVMERSNMPVNEVIDLLQPRVDSIGLAKTEEALPAGFRLDTPLEPNQTRLTRLESNGIAGVFRTADGYIWLSAKTDSMRARWIHLLVLQTLIICAGIASAGVFLAVRHSTRPLRELNAAIRHVARGDFEVRVDYRSRDEMGVVVQNFNWMVGELRNIEYLRKDFVSSVSHEFKTPVSAIRGSVKLLTATPFEKLNEAKFRKYMGLIADETERMSSLSSNLLRLSRLENQSAAENVINFSLDEQLRRCILLLEGQWSTKPVELDIQLDRIDYRGDIELLQQLWLNLLSNAIKFTDPGGNVGIKLRGTPEGGARVEISDDGVGMSPETQKRVFEKFYQGDNSRAREGNGLGLSIVRRIVELHSGVIVYKSELGKGTVCTVTLPGNR
ncbi:hypothetical protein B5F55_01130 [Anaerotruncus colihominis]|uniref:sensor histidine kinase n=1 Tax=Anaerotruncus colihominis TaxID=169435 RepID=UPI000B39929F|nr:HAMP domain-containing sensor histidine kinase [Anaerotruncus colihominis]OUO68852.1 hypothetical protein B5F55_01130 [Anaerotruncus colihominis]